MSAPTFVNRITSLLSFSRVQPFVLTSINAKGGCTERRLSQYRKSQVDFLECLQPDMALKILMCLDDSADLVRAAAVSQNWQNIVVSNGLSKQLCMRTCPQLASIGRVLEPNHYNSGERDHCTYASLFQAIIAFPLTSCIADPVSASSFDRYPDGTDDPEIHETLIFNLTANFFVVTEIDLLPYQDISPICSSRFVRFRMGHPKSWKKLNHDFIGAQECADDKFIWTYTSQMFPMAKVNFLQRFKLPEPVVCIGGYLQIQLLDRVQKAGDDKLSLHVAYVQVKGRELSPAFSVEFSEPSGRVSLKYDAEKFTSIICTTT